MIHQAIEDFEAFSFPAMKAAQWLATIRSGRIFQGNREQTMPATSEIIQISGLGKQKLAALRRQAKNLGMSAEGYARHLIEEGILLERLARTKSFDELFAPVQEQFRESGMTENDLDQLVNRARSRHQPGLRKKG